MEVKGLAYQSRQLDRSKDEHKAADFLAINPRGLVPVLKSEQNGQDVVVSEANADN
jgi:glutathione S-transferase